MLCVLNSKSRVTTYYIVVVGFKGTVMLEDERKEPRHLLLVGVGLFAACSEDTKMVEPH